jgi:hypothetical protein
MNNVGPSLIFYGRYKCTGNASNEAVFFDLFKELRKISF